MSEWEWVSIKERLPEPWALNDHCSVQVIICEWDRQLKIDCIWFWEVKQPNFKRYTHWMHVPALPDREEK